MDHFLGDHHLFIDMFFAMFRPVDCMVAGCSNPSLLLDVKKIEDGLRKDGCTQIPEETDDTNTDDQRRRLILAEIFARFHREYKPSETEPPNWDIEFYKIAKLKIIYAKQ